MVSDESLSTFIKIYFQEYGERLCIAKAYELANNLTNLYRAVYLVEEEGLDEKDEA